MTPLSTPGVSIPSPAISNLRDLGGWPTASGSVVRHAVFRSAQVGTLDSADGQALVDLGVRTVVDLRTQAERTAAPDDVPTGVDVVVADVLRDAPGAAAAQLGAPAGDPAALIALLEDGSAARMLADTYRQFVTLPSALEAYRGLYETLALGEPVLFHCTAGKDRTGWAAATLLLLLGVSYDEVLRDYLLTNEQLSAESVPLLAMLTSLGVDEAVVRPLVGVDRAYLDAGLDEVDARYGSIEAYVREGLGVSQATIDRLRSRLVAA